MKNLRPLLTLFSVIFLSTVIYAAPPPPPTGGTGGTAGNPSCWPPPCVPIDGGIALLMAAGAAYGAKKLYRARSAKNSVS